MEIQLDISTEPFRQGIEELLKEKGHVVSKQGIVLKAVRLYGKKLTVVLAHGEAEIGCSSKAHFYRGLMQLIMYMEGYKEGQAPQLGLEETVCFDNNGAMLDCSRNGVLNIDTIKKYIRLHASLGLNTMMLYTEDTYEVQGELYFGAFRGRYTQAELRECDAYAEIFGIEIVPCIQTLAHLRTLLRWECYQELKDINDILLTGSERVYELLEKMIHSISSSFRTKRIHLGMDEAHCLGLGKYLDKNGYQNRFDIMSYHLERVNKLCLKYHLEPMIWSDMYFRLKSPTGDYYNLPENTEFPEMARPPENVTLVYWDYYNDKEEHYRNYFRLHRKLGKRTVFAGGAWTWNGIAPNISAMYSTVVPALKACREEGIKEVTCTFWQDNGAETPLCAGETALVLFAECGFGKTPDRGEVQKWLDFLRGKGTFEGLCLLDRFDSMKGVLENNSNADNPSKFLFYQDVLLGLFDGQINGLAAGLHYKSLADDLEKLQNRYPHLGELFVYYGLLAKFLSVKAELGCKITEEYRLRHMDRLEHMEKNDLRNCLSLLEEIRNYRERLWFMECRPFGYEVLDIRFGGLEARLRSAGKRLQMFTKGEVPALEELEEARLPYKKDNVNQKHKLCSVNLWENIVSAGNIAGI